MPADAAVVLDAVELVERTGHLELRARFCVPAAHPVLAGHFPGAALVPGVLLLQAVRLACEQACHRALAIHEVSDVRFFQPVLPDTVVLLSAQVREQAPGLQVEGECSGTDGRVAAFRLRLGPGIQGIERAT